MRSKSQLHHHSWASILLYTVIYNSVKDELEHKEVSTGDNKAEKAAVMYKRKDKAFESAAAVGID